MGKNDKKSRDSKKSGRYLEHGTVVLNTINQKMNVHNTIYSWTVPNYSKLKCNAMYYQVFGSDDVECVFKLFKTKSTLYLCLRSSLLVKKRAQFYVLNEPEHTSLIVQATEIRGGLYTGEFKYELFEKPEKKYLQDGMLTVSFRYISDVVRDYSESAFDGVDILSDLDELCCDLKHMYLESMYPDFEIKAKDYVFKAHKFILSSRSDFFQKYFNKNPNAREITVDTFPGILHEVLLYMYCGELKDMNLACMLSVLELADDLEIANLIEKCFEYFEKHAKESNFNELQTFQQEKNFALLDGVLEKIKAKMPYQ